MHFDIHYSPTHELCVFFFSFFYSYYSRELATELVQKQNDNYNMQTIYIYIFQEYGKPVYSYSTNPDRRFSSSTSQHFKMSPPFASSEGVSASGDRLQSDGVQDTHLLPHSLSTRIRERMCDFALTHSHSPFAYFAYISSYSLLIILSEVL